MKQVNAVPCIKKYGSLKPNLLKITNMKKVFLGLFVAAVALSASAFTNVKKVAPGDRYVQATSGIYSKTTAYDALLCDESSQACSYIQVLPGTFTSPLSQTDIDNANAANPGTFVPQEEGIYTGPIVP